MRYAYVKVTGTVNHTHDPGTAFFPVAPDTVVYKATGGPDHGQALRICDCQAGDEILFDIDGEMLKATVMRPGSI